MIRSENNNWPNGGMIFGQMGEFCDLGSPSTGILDSSLIHYLQITSIIILIFMRNVIK